MSNSLIKLVILDISGVLCVKDKTKRSKHGEKLGKKIATNHYDVYLRPHAKEFIKECLEKYDVGIFSSTTYQNVNNILKELVSPLQRKALKFIWCRDRCDLDPGYGKDESITKFDTIKNLSSIISSPYINESREYSLDNIIAIDDSEKKMRFNNSNNYLIVKSFKLEKGCEEDNELMTTLLSIGMLGVEISSKIKLSELKKDGGLIPSLLNIDMLGVENFPEIK